MSVDVIEKSLPLTVNDTTSSDASEIKPWTSDMDANEEQATDQILGYLIQSGSRPYVDVTGDIIDIITAVVNTLQQHVPSNLSEPLKIMTDYIARWLCDYLRGTNITSLRVCFGFDARLTQEENA